jgi:hypothetical protein
MNVTHLPPIDHHGAFSKKRMNLQPTVGIQLYYFLFEMYNQLEGRLANAFNNLV